MTVLRVAAMMAVNRLNVIHAQAGTQDYSTRDYPSAGVKGIRPGVIEQKGNYGLFEFIR